MLHKVRNIVREHGLSGLAGRSIAFAYRRGVRPCIPFGKAVHYAGIPICHDRKWGDRMVPMSWVPNEALADQPLYEAALVRALRETIKPGDSVVIVGGGLGVTAVIAALRTGPSGTVQCFEGSKQHVRFVRQTVARNIVTNVIVRHAVVAKSIAVHGSGSNVGIVFSFL